MKFSIVVLTQLLVAILWYKKGYLNLKTLFGTISVSALAILLIFITNDIPLRSLWGRGLRHFPLLSDFKILTNIGYSILMPLIKAPIDFYSKHSDHFSLDCVSKAFHDATPYWVLGYSYTCLYLWGIFTLAKKTWIWWYKNRNLNYINKYLIYGITFSIFYVIIIGIAGPSYARLLPFSIIISIITGLGINNLIHFIKKTKSSYQATTSLILLLTALFLIPYETYFLINKVQNNEATATWFNRNTISMFEKINSNKAYYKKTKYVICPHNMEICKLYSREIPNMTPVHSFTEIPSYSFSSQHNNKVVKKVYVFWPQYSNYADNFISHSYKSDYNQNDYVFHFHLNKIVQSHKITGVQEIKNPKNQVVYRVISVLMI